MIEFKAIASSSEGNAYIVTDGDSSILLECGIGYREIQKAFNFKLTQVAGCLLTHEHSDHAKSLKEILRAGIKTYTSQGTADSLEIKHHNLKTVAPLQQFKIGTWTILPFDTEHDTAEPYGYLIANSKGEKLLFATDTYYIRYRFKNLSIVAVECNYSEVLLRQNILNGVTPLVMRSRLQRSHFSLENFKEFLLANEKEMQDVREIWLLHMSDKNSDEDLFKDEVQRITGKPVYIA